MGKAQRVGQKACVALFIQTHRAWRLGIHVAPPRQPLLTNLSSSRRAGLSAKRSCLWRGQRKHRGQRNAQTAMARKGPPEAQGGERQSRLQAAHCSPPPATPLITEDPPTENLASPPAPFFLLRSGLPGGPNPTPSGPDSLRSRSPDQILPLIASAARCGHLQGLAPSPAQGPHLRGALQLHLELRQPQRRLRQGLAQSLVLTAQLCVQL